MNQARIRQAVQSGANWLRARQRPDGSFASYISTDPQLQVSLTEEQSVFASAVILRSLQCVPSHTVNLTVERGRGFLLSQMSAAGCWQYWARGWRLELPPDLDDTALCLLQLADTLPPEVRAGAVARLMANRDAHGRFKTWVLPPGVANDVDSVVNANVICLLGDGPATAEASRYVVESIVNQQADFGSHYYLHHFSLFHAVSLAINAGVSTFESASPVMRNALDSACSSESVLVNAQQLSAALLLKLQSYSRLESLVGGILGAQLPSGAWGACPYYCGPQPPAEPSYWFGSAEMTTAICIEALSRYVSRCTNS